MARIPEQAIEGLKREVHVAEQVRADGIVLKAHGANLIGLCPFHPDTSPSLVVTESTNLFHCLGCGVAGSSIDWVMKRRGIEFREAVKLMLREYGGPGSVIRGREETELGEQTTRDEVALDAEDYELLDRTVTHWQHTLAVTPAAQEYLRSRGLDSAEMIEHFRIGFSDGRLCDRLPHTRDAQLRKLGVFNGGGHEHFADCLVIPIFDEQGHVSEIYGRKITPGPRKDTPSHLYLPGPHRGVWDIEALQASREIILCEALIDALTFWCAGFRNVTASYGVEGFTKDHIAAFRRYGTLRLLIAYDSDQAGDRAAKKLAARLPVNHGIGCFRVEFPKGMDANEYALKVTPAAKSLGLLLRTARWMGKGPAPALRCAEEPAITSVPETISVEIAGAPAPPAAKETAGNEPTTPVASTEVQEPLSLAAAPPPAEPPTPPTTNHQLPTSNPEPRTEIDDHQVAISLGNRTYRVWGLDKNTSYELLKVTVKAVRGDTFHKDTVDLCAAEKRNRFIKEAASELGLEPAVVKKDLGKVLAKLEELQDALIQKALAPQEKVVALSPAEHKEAMGLLTAPNLLDLVLEHYDLCGVVGEQTNKLICYLGVTSRLLPNPLHITIQSSSAAGKSALMDGTLAFVPEEAKVKYSAMTGQSLFYMSGRDLRHKVLAIAEGEGASRATYPLKLLQSEGELSIASTGKDPHTGKLVTHDYHVPGPVMAFSTTTAVELDEELQNRSITLAIDESREQTQRIHRQQRFERTVEGIWQKEERAAIRKLHQNAQRLLKPYDVLNPFIADLGFTDRQTRARRDHPKYLALMDAIALLHQYQRPIKTIARNGKQKQCVVVTREDVALANKLASEVFGRFLDELSPQTRRFLIELHKMVTEASQRLKIDREDYRFSRREIREYTGWSDFQVRAHMEKLLKLEYVIAHHGKRGQSFVYELVYAGEGQHGEKFMLGLFDPEKVVLPHLEAKFEHRKGEFEGGNGKFEGSSSIHRASIEPPSSIGQNGSEPLCEKGESDFEPEIVENAYIRGHGAGNGASTLSPSPASEGNGYGPGLEVSGSWESEPPTPTNHEPPTTNHANATPTNHEPATANHAKRKRA